MSLLLALLLVVGAGDRMKPVPAAIVHDETALLSNDVTAQLLTIEQKLHSRTGRLIAVIIVARAQDPNIERAAVAAADELPISAHWSAVLYYARVDGNYAIVYATDVAAAFTDERRLQIQGEMESRFASGDAIGGIVSAVSAIGDGMPAASAPAPTAYEGAPVFPPWAWFVIGAVVIAGIGIMVALTAQRREQQPVPPLPFEVEKAARRDPPREPPPPPAQAAPPPSEEPPAGFARPPVRPPS